LAQDSLMPATTLFSDADIAELVALRRTFHAYPELSFCEARTSDRIAALLAEWGIPTHRGLAKTGVVGVLKAGSSTRAIGLRADMDALPISELNQFAHRSTVPGVMHACGHDGHVAMLLAGAKYLSASRRFDGTVYLVFQPAEEAGGGARRMIDDGLFRLCPMDAIYGIHNWPGLSAGHFAVSPGAVFGSSSTFRILVRGRGAHGAFPHEGRDPIPAACQIVLALQTIISRNKSALEPAVLSVTMLKAGELNTASPDVCEIHGTVRTFSLKVLELIERRMGEIIAGTCQAFGLSNEFNFVRYYPPTINDPGETQFVRRVLENQVGPERVQEFTPTTGAEDFSYYLQQKPGCYFVIGNGDHRADGNGSCVLHSAAYDFNDDLIAIGGGMWVNLVEARLGLGVLHPTIDAEQRC
jgi:amidohydrolase